MNRNQRAGCVFVIVGLALVAIALLLSFGWGNPDTQLIIYYIGPQEYDSAFKDLENTRIYTKYVLAILVLPITYGVLLYSSLAPWFSSKAGASTLPDEARKTPDAKEP